MSSEQSAVSELQKLIDMLRSFRQRPAMYLGSIKADLAVAWLNGLRAYESFIAKEIDEVQWHEFRRRSVESRGLEWSARHPADEMLERGMEDAEVVDALLLIEIAVLESACSFLTGHGQGAIDGKV